ncbi:MAG: 30S ribosomal protein S12 methylthiotransferase RimO [Bacteroidales bacterium]
MRKRTINIISLGCAKNLVDSQRLMRQFALDGWDVRFESDKPADVALLNTCGFIADAKEESIDTILALTEAKKSGQYQKVIVFGCLSERYKHDLQQEVPEVDHFFGVNDHSDILQALSTPLRKPWYHERMLTSAKHYAYLKVSEGCNRKCSFCIIPSIRGKHLSVTHDNLIREARFLASEGVKELLLVAQDLSSYGTDLKQKGALVRLLSGLEEIPGIEWIRLHYAYPAGFPEEVITMMGQSSKIVKYLDIPFQHASPRLLKSMRRGHTIQDANRLIAKLRNAVPGIALRTTLITGYPSETEKDFNLLMKFVRESRFERLGVFTYSEEEGTTAASLPDDIPPEVKQERAMQIMELQETLSLENNRALIGKEMLVIVDRAEDNILTARTEYDSPEVDQEVIIPGYSRAVPGDFLNAVITDAGPYELIAKLA